MNIPRVLIALLALAIANLTIAEPGSVTVTAVIDTNKDGAEINRNVFGQFAEHKGRLIYDGIWVGENSNIPNTRGIRNDVVAALRKLHVPVVRWPGGCFADGYHWRDGIGPRDHRPQRISIYGQVETNQFGTHEFMDFADQIGAEAYISINVGSGTPQEARDWLEYMTAEKGSLAALRRENGRDKPWKVKYVGVGNEAWGCGGFMRANYYADNLRRYKLFLSDFSGRSESPYLIASGPNNDDLEWTRTLMQNESWTFPHSDIRINFMDAISLHYYTFPKGEWLRPKDRGHALGFSEEDWFLTLASAIRMDELLSQHSSVMDQYDPDKKVALVVDEWGAVYAPESQADPAMQQNSLRDAVVAALTLNIFIRHTDRVKMANISMIINVIQAMILTDKEKMLVTPTYDVFDLYQVFQGAIPYATSTSGPRYEVNKAEMSAVDVSAARGKDGRTYLALVNLDPSRSATVTTNLSGKASGKIITGPDMDSHNTFEAPDAIRPMPFFGRNDNLGRLDFLLPAKSIAVVAVE